MKVNDTGESLIHIVYKKETKGNETTTLLCIGVILTATAVRSSVVGEFEIN